VDEFRVREKRAQGGALFAVVLAGLRRLTDCCSEGAQAVRMSGTTPRWAHWLRLAPQPAADAKRNPASFFLSAKKLLKDIRGPNA